MIRRRHLLALGASLGAQCIAPRAPWGVQRAMAVATRCNYPGLGFSDGSMRWMASRLAHSVPATATGIQLVYGNFAAGERQFEHPGFNPITISAELEYPEGRLHRATFGGVS